MDAKRCNRIAYIENKNNNFDNLNMINDIEQSILKLKKIAHLEDSFSTVEQSKLITTISQNSQGLISLFELLISRHLYEKRELSYLDSIIFKSIYNCKIDNLKIQLNEQLKEGIVKLESKQNLDYKPLYISLVSNDLKRANELTQIYLNKLAQINPNNARQWLYFTDVLSLPIQDLQTIDQLWKIYSIGKFGFSTQRKIWLYHNKDWEKFWHIIGWKINKRNVRYPDEFTWNYTAPRGHLPLFNQIRGVQVLSTLFSHPAWEINNEKKL